ncbi:MAG: amidase [Gemmatimonadaceae bacterium]
MPSHDELTLRSAIALRDMVRRRELSPVELLDATLARIARCNPQLNAIVTLDAERARADAEALTRRLARGEDIGILGGLPVGIKDVTPVAGVRTTFGSPMYRDHVPDEDAEVVTRLRAAGAIVIGKTNTPEFAAGGNTFNPVFGRTRNPWHLERSAGGSTGGGAASLATGMIALAEGTDLGGSLRIPASFCGVVGLRPSVGLVPTHPSDYVWDTLQVTGPMARTAVDVALMLQAIAGRNRFAPLAAPDEGRDYLTAAVSAEATNLRVAYCPDVAGIGVDPVIERVCREGAFALRDQGTLVEETALDLAFARPAFLALRGYWFASQHFTRLERSTEFGPNVANNIKAGLSTDMRAFAAAEHARGSVWHMMREVFTRVDALVTPCMPVSPFPVEQNYPATVAGQQMETYVDWLAPTFVLSMTGLPVACVPAGLDGEGLPVGLQIVGPPQGEERVLALAAAVQALRPIGAPSMA